MKRRKLSPPAQAHSDTTLTGPISCTYISPIKLNASFSPRYGKNTYIYGPPPPTAAELSASTDQYGIPSKIYRDPYYSKECDAPEKPREYAGLVFHLKSGEGISNLEEWKTDDSALSLRGAPARALDRTGVGGWEYASTPPSVRQVRKWLKEQKGRLHARSDRKKDSSQVCSILRSVRRMKFHSFCAD